MALRRLLESGVESVQEMELAAGQRFAEAQVLLAEGRWAAAIYLAGYSAEMLLKCAFCYSRGASPAALVQPFFGPARHLLRRRGASAIDHESYHSLLFWCASLRAARNYHSKPLDPLIENRLCQCTRRLYQQWWVEMRYRQDRSDANSANRVFADITWLRENYRLLRR